MARPAKSAATIKAEGKSHRTKAEMELREKGEQELLSGTPIFERSSVKKNPVSHKEFLRLRKLLKKIGKDDALYAPVYNRYCEIFAEIQSSLENRQELCELLNSLKVKFDKFDNPTYKQTMDFAKQVTNMLKQINALESTVMYKRRMLFDIEKENVMTVSAALKSIPKIPEKKENALLKILTGDDDGG